VQTVQYWGMDYGSRCLNYAKRLFFLTKLQPTLMLVQHISLPKMDIKMWTDIFKFRCIIR